MGQVCADFRRFERFKGLGGRKKWPECVDKSDLLWYNERAGITAPGDGTHYKKQRTVRGTAYRAGTAKLNRGRHPLEKNGNRETEASAPQKTVQVTDEAGNRYEATYPRRAKGLVKHGRARFTDESQTEIILTCPPNQNLILEDQTMTEQNTHIQTTENETMVATESIVPEKNVPQLTAKEIFDQIVTLQRQMLESSYNALYRLTDATYGICGDGCFESDEAKGEAIESVASAFRMREDTYQQMLNVYQQMYNDLRDRRSEYDRIKNVLLDMYERRVILVKESDDLDDGSKYHLLQQLSHSLVSIMETYQ